MLSFLLYFQLYKTRKMASYEIIESHRKDSTVYRHGANTCRKYKDSHGVRYLRCVRYRDGCSARARIDLDSDTFSVIGEHEGHESTEKQIEISKVVSKLKRRAEFSQGTLRETFDEEANQSEVGGCISFPRIEGSVYKRRRIHRPQIPLILRTQSLY